MTHTITAVALTLALTACDGPIGVSTPDQCMRAELFASCMRALPAGPAAPQFNDWDEVVTACESAAYRQSLRSARHIKPECRL
jgi:hypothetical protein